MVAKRATSIIGRIFVFEIKKPPIPIVLIGYFLPHQNDVIEVPLFQSILRHIPTQVLT